MSSEEGMLNINHSMSHIHIQPTADGIEILRVRDRKELADAAVDDVEVLLALAIGILLLLGMGGFFWGVFLCLTALPVDWEDLLYAHPRIFGMMSVAVSIGLLAVLMRLLKPLVTRIDRALPQMSAMLRKTSQQKANALSAQAESSLRISGNMMTVKTQHYEISQISDLHVNIYKNKQQGSLSFRYRRRKKRILMFSRLPLQEAHALCHTLSELLTFRCHLVTVIVFGERIIEPVPSQEALYNPDVIRLTVPFQFLRRLVIHTDTYNFSLLERFLTYAVNVLGQEYLATQVDAHIYGEPAHLHPNLRNNLTNLCRRVYTHTA